MEYGVKAGLKGLVANEIAQNISSEDLDHLVMLPMMGDNKTTDKYMVHLQDKYASTIAVDPKDIPKLEGLPIPEEGKGWTTITPIPERDKNEGILGTPITEQDKDAGIMAGPEIKIRDWRDDILTSEKGKTDSTINSGDFFDGTRYTDKVKQQASSGDYHAFPEAVDGFAEKGKVTEIIGGDGVPRLKLEISGEYKGQKGVFEYIKNSDGTINHRLFVPKK